MAHPNIDDRRAHVKRLVDNGVKINGLLRKFMAFRYECSVGAICHDILLAGLPKLETTIHVNPTMRRLILTRDDRTCQYCGTTEGEIIVEHVIPARQGGHAKPYNLVAACHPCNMLKCSSTWFPNNFLAITENNKEWREKIIKKVQSPS